MVAQVHAAPAVELERPAAADVLVNLASQALLGSRAVEVATGVVAGLGHGIGHALPPVVDHRAHLVDGGHGRPGFPHSRRQRAGEIDHPSLARPLEGHPLGVVPVDNGREVAAVLPAEPCAAVAAVANVRPEEHVEEHAVKLISAAELFSLREGEVAVRRVGAAHTVAIAAIDLHAIDRLDPPVGVLHECDVVEHHAVVGHHRGLVAVKFLDRAADKVLAAQVGVHRAHF